MVRAYGSAAWAFILLLIANRGFYALGDRQTPVRIGKYSVAWNLGISLLLIYPLKGAGLAWGTSLATMLQAVWSMRVLARQCGGIEPAAARAVLLKTVIACTVMSTVVLGLQSLLAGYSMKLQLAAQCLPGELPFSEPPDSSPARARTPLARPLTSPPLIHRATRSAGSPLPSGELGRAAGGEGTSPRGSIPNQSPPFSSRTGPSTATHSGWLMLRADGWKLPPASPTGTCSRFNKFPIVIALILPTWTLVAVGGEKSRAYHGTGPGIDPENDSGEIAPALLPGGIRGRHDS